MHTNQLKLGLWDWTRIVSLALSIPMVLAYVILATADDRNIIIPVIIALGHGTIIGLAIADLTRKVRVIRKNRESLQS